MLKTLFLILTVGYFFLGCSTKQPSVGSVDGAFTGTFMVHSEENFPVSLFPDNSKDCFYKGNVKRYENNTERFIIKLNKQVCQNGIVNDIEGYVVDASDGKIGVKTLMIGTKVEVFIVISSSGKVEEK